MDANDLESSQLLRNVEDNSDSNSTRVDCNGHIVDDGDSIINIWWSMDVGWLMDGASPEYTTMLQCS